DAVGDACQLAVVTCRLFRAGQKVVPVEIGMLLVDLFEQFLVILHVRLDPPCHADRELHDVDAAASGAEFGTQPRAPGIDRQQGEVDLDAGGFLEGRRHLLHHAPVPGAVVADIDQLFRFALCLDLWCRQHAAGNDRCLQKPPPVQSGHVFPHPVPQPLTAPDDSPATRCRCAANEKMTTGSMTSTPEAVMTPQSTPVSPPENAAIRTGSVLVALFVSTAANRKSFHASCTHRILAATRPGRMSGSTTCLKAA